MSHAPLSAAEPSDLEAVAHGRDVLRREAEALLALAARLNGAFAGAVGLVLACRGSVIVTGMGKAGIVGRKIAATLASTGTPSHFLHPAEAVHGDLGRVGSDDLLLALSNSGETEEIVRLLPWFAARRVPIVAITGRGEGTLARAAAATLELGVRREACHLGLAPSTSTTAMLGLGDALALVVSRLRGFGREEFNRCHPAGALGRRLARVEEQMRRLEECRVAADDRTVREVFVAVGRPGRRSGAIMLVDAAGRLSGVFTDSDLARLFEGRRDEALDRPIAEVMTRRPRTIAAGSTLGDAVELLGRHRISELPVVDEHLRPLGLIDITDLVDLIPPHEAPQAGEDGADGRGARLSVYPSGG